MSLIVRCAVVVFVVVLAGCGSSKTKTVTVTETKTVTARAAAAPATEAPAPTSEAGGTAIGEEQTYENVGNIEINGKPVSSTLKVRVSALKAHVAAPQYLDPDQGNRYVRIDVRISNVGTDSFTPAADFQVVTKEGASATFQSLGRAGDLGPAAIRPGRTARGRVWAQIPKSDQVQDIVFAPFGGNTDLDLVWSRT